MYYFSCLLFASLSLDDENEVDYYQFHTLNALVEEICLKITPVRVLETFLFTDFGKKFVYCFFAQILISGHICQFFNIFF